MPQHPDPGKIARPAGGVGEEAPGAQIPVPSRKAGGQGGGVAWFSHLTILFRLPTIYPPSWVSFFLPLAGALLGASV